jgi:hypothetical protein
MVMISWLRGSRRVLLSAMMAMVLGLWFSNGAEASCLRKGGDKGALKEAELRPETNDSITLLYWLEGVSVCVVRVPIPDGYEMIETSIAGQPLWGIVKQIDRNVVQYTKNPGHMGMDHFAVKVCAKKRFATSGCTHITYNMNSIKGKQGQTE